MESNNKKEIKHIMVLHEVHQEKIEFFLNWSKELTGDLKEDAISSLKEENVLLESMFLFNLNGKCYLIGFAEFFDKLKPANPNRPINIKHKKVLNEFIVNSNITELKKAYSLRVEEK